MNNYNYINLSMKFHLKVLKHKHNLYRVIKSSVNTYLNKNKVKPKKNLYVKKNK